MKNDYFINGEVVTIFVKCKGVAYPCFIDINDFGIVDSFPNTWYAVESRNTKYVQGKISVGDGKQERVHLHRYILGCGNFNKDSVVDHIDTNGLNNKRDNLRLVDIKGNSHNRKTPNRKSRSNHLNVAWVSERSKWRVTICRDLKIHHFGDYEDLNEAIDVAKRERKALTDGNP